MGFDGPLPRQLLNDFSAGVELDVAAHLVDPRGLVALENGLLSDDGSIYLRGCSRYKSNAPFDQSVRSAWDGFLSPGHRTVVSTPQGFWALGSDDKTPVRLNQVVVGSPGSPTGVGSPVSTGSGLQVPIPAVAVEALLFLPGGYIYGGSLKSADYTAGAVQLFNGQKRVIGLGTAFLANVDAGMLFRVHGTHERCYVVERVVSDTELALRDAYEGTTRGVVYTLSRLLYADAPYKTSFLYANAAERLIVLEPDGIVRFSKRSKPHLFEATDFHQLEYGADIRGAQSLGTDLLVFTTRGYWVIRNMAFNLTDALGALQQREEHVSRDLVLWGPAGIAGYRNALVVPALDGIYLVDGDSQPVAISKGISPRYHRYIELGYRPGQAEVYQDHYLLPILAVNGRWIDTLVCRLDRPIKVRSQTFFPWSWLSGSGARSAFFCKRAPQPSQEPQLLAGDLQTGRLTNVDDFFDADSPTGVDHDGAERELSLTTRDLPTGPPNSIGRLRRVRITGDFGGADSAIGCELFDNDVREGAHYGTEGEAAIYGTDVYTSRDALAHEQVTHPSQEATPADLLDGRAGFSWYTAQRTRYARIRLRSSGPVERLIVRSIEIWAATAGRVRHSRVREKV